MGGLLEAAFSLSLSALLVAMTTGALAAQLRLAARCNELAERFFAERQLEQLADRAMLSAGAGPLHPAALASLDASDVVTSADLDGDGVVSTNSAETTALELREDSGTARVRVRFGRQTMTVLEAEGAVAELQGFDRHGAAATAGSATRIELHVRGSDTDERLFVFSLPQRLLP